MDHGEHDQNVPSPQPRGERLGRIGWGVFFIWIGLVFLTNMGWGVGLFGVGLILTAGEVARRYLRLPADWPRLIMGIVFMSWGTAELLEIKLGTGLLPVLSIVAGAVILLGALVRKSPH